MAHFLLEGYRVRLRKTVPGNGKDVRITTWFERFMLEPGVMGCKLSSQGR